MIDIDWSLTTDSLISTDLIIWLVHHTPQEGKHRGRTWLIKAQNLRTQQFAALYRRQWVKMYHIFDEQVMIALVTFCVLGCLLALCECEWIFEISAYFNNHLILCYFKLSNFLFDGCPPICETQKSFKHNPSFSREL